MHADQTKGIFRSLRTIVTLSLLLLSLLAVPAISQAATPVIFYSDLDSGPNTGGENNNGVYVTIWGNNFGATRSGGSVTVGGGQVNNYPLWSDTKITFQLGSSAATGNIVVTASNGTSNGIPFTVRSGRILFVTPTGTGNGSVGSPMSPSAAYAGIQPGDTYYFRAGTYSGQYGAAYGTNNYGLGPTKSGTAGNPVAFVGYPNEAAVFQNSGTNFSMRDNDPVDAHANYITIANFTLIGGGSCVAGAGVTIGGGQVAKSGAYGMRVIGNVMSATYGSANTMTGLVTVNGDANRILGNEFKDTGAEPAINNNHIIYVSLGASDVDIGWNYIHDVIVGHVIQVHTDAFFSYYNVRIHDNVIAKGLTGDSRGINIGNANGDSYGSIYNNIIDSVGQNFSAIAMYSGSWKVYNNTIYNAHASSSMVWVSNLVQQFGGAAGWSQPTADIRNNIFYSDGQSPYVAAVNGASMSQLTLSNNLYYNHGAAPSQDPAAVTADPLFINPLVSDFHLQSAASASSPAIDHGSSVVNTVVSMDHDGNPRPQGAGFDSGAYESAGPSLPSPNNLTLRRL